MDGFSADTGLGDDLVLDEDGDGTPYDRIFGLPAITATKIDPALAESVGFGDSFGYHVAGDIQGPLNDLLYGGCLAQVADGVYGGCIGQVYDGVMAQCEDAGGPVNAVTGLCYDASQSPEFAGACSVYGAAGALTATCLQLGFSEEVCADAAAQAAPAVGLYCDSLDGEYDGDTCEDMGTTDCAVLTNPDFSLGLCGTLAGSLTTSETCTEWLIVSMIMMKKNFLKMVVTIQTMAKLSEIHSLMLTLLV
jgi:hypothetical protein